MAAERIVFICKRCLTAAEEAGECCGQARLRCNAGEPGSARSRPLYDEEGRLLTHAPRWWVEQQVPGESPS